MKQGKSLVVVRQQKDSSPWLKELLVIKSLIEKHPVLAGASAILLPSVSIYHYTMREHVPLSVTSSDVITALPSVLAAIAFLVVALTALLLIPVSLMFEGSVRDPDGRLRIFRRDPAQGRRDIRDWLFAFTLPGVFIAVGVCASAFWIPDTEWLLIAAIIIASATFTWTVRQKKGDSVKTFFSETTFNTFALSFLQMLLAIFVMQGALKIFGKSPSNAQVMLAMIGSVLLFPVVQMAAVRLIVHTSQRHGFVMQAFIGSVFLIAAMCLIPPTGATLAGHVISGSASGYTPCTQLRLSSDASDFIEIRNTEGPLTIPLRILSNASGSYLVRKSDGEDQTVYRIPDASVIALSPCPKEKNET